MASGVCRFAHDGKPLLLQEVEDFAPRGAQGCCHSDVVIWHHATWRLARLIWVRSWTGDTDLKDQKSEVVATGDTDLKDQKSEVVGDR